MVQPETRIQQAIQKMAREEFNAFIFKVHGSETMMAGLPDLIICHKGIFIGMEVKTATGVVSAIQHRRLTEIAVAGGVAVVVRSVSDARIVMTAVDLWGNDTPTDTGQIMATLQKQIKMRG